MRRAIALVILVAACGAEPVEPEPEPQASAFGVTTSVSASQSQIGFGCRVTWKGTSSDPSVLVQFRLERIEGGNFRGSIERSWNANAWSSDPVATYPVIWHYDVGLWNHSGLASVSSPPGCHVRIERP